MKLRQELYGHTINSDIIDWIHPYEKVKNSLLASLQYNGLIDLIWCLKSLRANNV